MTERTIVKSVADLERDAIDMLGNIVIDIYGRKPPEYGVYRTHERVMLMFADTPDKADKQRKALARLNPLRSEINGLIDGWREARPPVGEEKKTSFLRWFWSMVSGEAANQRRAARFDRDVGAELSVAFEGDVASAEVRLDAIRQKILDLRIARGRIQYLFAAALTVAAMLLLTRWWTGRLTCPDVDLKSSPVGLAEALWHCAAAGAFGAFFSIALAIRGRTVLPNLERVSNVTDAALRVVIGIIGAAVFMGLMVSQLVTIKLFETELSRLDWIAVLLVGFIAGFSERLVPDLLEKASAIAPSSKIVFVPQPQPAPQAGGGSAGGEGGGGGAGPGAGSGAADPGDDPDPLPEEADHDCCAAGIDVPDEIVAHDEQLPAASGGIAKPAN